MERRACQRETLTEGVIEAVEALRHVRAHPGRYFEGDTMVYDLVSFPCGDGHYAMTLMFDTALAQWQPRPAKRWRRVGRALRHHRMSLLHEALSDSQVSEHTIAQVMTSQDSHWGQLGTHAAMLHWWDQQISEGHSPETARTMLGLLAGEAIHRIEWSSEGHPLPRLECHSLL